VKGRWVRAWEYVKKLADAQDHYRADEARARGKMDEVDWEKARQVSREHQLERYKVRFCIEDWLLRMQH
jgi:hypothetical protein